MMKRFTGLMYGLLCYVVFLATFVYAIGFVGNIWVPKGIDSAPNVPMAQALLINLGLLTLFAVQHSCMARRSFKRWITRWVPTYLERSTYVLVSSLALIVLFRFWEPMGGLVWHIDYLPGRTMMYTGFAVGWLMVLLSTFLINHFDLFGLRQVWLNFLRRPYTALEFNTPWLYRVVRHPLYLGWLLAFWSTPTMTIAHLVFALATTAYILVAIQLEERDLMQAHPEYKRYRKRVPMIIPLPLKRMATNLHV
jgi:protein-S-isoprenylcysteine O-methyltransferase Ste14